MKPISTRNVLDLWLFSKIGVPRLVKPIGGTSSFQVDGLQTMQVCALRVESIEGFCPALLRIWLDGSGVSSETAMLECVDFEAALEKSLQESPIFPVDREDRAVTEIQSYTLREIGEKLGGLHPQQVKRFMDEEGYILPGVFQFGGHWKILNFDILKEKYQKPSKIAS